MLTYGKKRQQTENITHKNSLRIPGIKMACYKFAHMPYKEMVLPRVLHCFLQFFFVWLASRVQKTYTRLGLPFTTKYQTKSISGKSDNSLFYSKLVSLTLIIEQNFTKFKQTTNSYAEILINLLKFSTMRIN